MMRAPHFQCFPSLHFKLLVPGPSANLTPSPHPNFPRTEMHALRRAESLLAGYEKCNNFFFIETHSIFKFGFGS